ncbi:elongation of very long chain fatty acids protein 4-like [Mytilus californianus]|uniref:elongation of very long chain fatty acids protein 4-like n=1 Tax=Mytilus californianus TaxID=6549 RepID=UPI0022454C1D|nr:elongation of very long chain fatty acids protein 4-like [Mytilus californianus]
MWFIVIRTELVNRAKYLNQETVEVSYKEFWSHNEFDKMAFFDDIRKIYINGLKRADPRVEKWPLMQSPVPIIIVFCVYVSMVLLCPKFVKKLPPMNLKLILVPYNFVLVALSVYMFVEFITVSLLSNYSYQCQPVDYSEDYLAVRMAKVLWWFFFSKVIELIDTLFLILRKNQVSFLHAYHHCTMILTYWMGVKYVAGGQGNFDSVSSLLAADSNQRNHLRNQHYEQREHSSFQC